MGHVNSGDEAKTHVQNGAVNRAKQTSYIFSLKYAIFCFCASHLLYVESTSPGSAASLNLFHPLGCDSGTTSRHPPHITFLLNPPEALSCFCSPPKAPSRPFLVRDRSFSSRHPIYALAHLIFPTRIFCPWGQDLCVIHSWASTPNNSGPGHMKPTLSKWMNE